jgi:hypothetical protein
MGRKTATYSVTEKNRDEGKTFLITEMSAAQGESWAMRTLMALMSSNVDIPPNYQKLGMAALATMGFKALSGLKWETAEPLLQEMMDCVKFIPDARKPSLIRPLLESHDPDNADIEEVSTRVNLRLEVWKLHTDFLLAVLPSLRERFAELTGKSSRTKVARA